MFTCTEDKFNNNYTESLVNSDVDSVIFKFIRSETVQECKQLKDSLVFDKQLTVWFDQKRISKFFIFKSYDGEIFVILQPRLEFIMNYSFEKLIYFLRDFTLSIYPNKSIVNFIHINLSQALPHSLMPKIDNLRWFEVK